MKRWLVIPSCLAILLGINAQSAEAVPTTASVTMRAVDTNGNPVSGAVNITIRTWDMETGGTVPLHEESHTTPAAEGYIYIDLGSSTPLDASVFDGGDRWLEIVFNGTVMTPRLKVGAVPYAIKASDSDSVGGLAASDLQQRVSGQCNAGSSIRVINANGTVTCEADTDTNTDTHGTLNCTNVTASGTIPANSTGSATATCASGYVVTGGGCNNSSNTNNIRVWDFYFSGNGFYCRYGNTSGTQYSISSYARCCRVL